MTQQLHGNIHYNVACVIGKRSSTNLSFLYVLLPKRPRHYVVSCKISATITIIVDNVFVSYKKSLHFRWRAVQSQILRVVSTSFVVCQGAAASLILHYEQASMIESDSMTAMLLRRGPLLNMIRDVSRCSVLILP